MVCRIHVVQEPDGRTVHLSGHLAAAQLGEVVDACAAPVGQLRIDLTDLISADDTALEALRALAGEGAEFVGVLAYLRHKVGAT